MKSLKGISFDDPVMRFYDAADLSLFIFLLTYLPLLFYLIIHRNSPEDWLRYLQAYALLVGMRMLTIFILPLEEPAGAIRLSDPVLNTFFYPGGYSPHDLFFSGHTATLILFGLFTPGNFRYLFFFLALLLGIFLVVQKVHYSIDVIAAPFFALIATKLVLNFGKKTIQSSPSS